jgi:uncharacterized protein involved in exopolysaccharide biosynthesis
LDAYTRSAREDEFTVGRLVHVSWKYRWTVLLSMLGCGGLFAVVSLFMTPIFRAEATVAEVHTMDDSAAGGLLNQLGGIAGMAGMNLKGPNQYNSLAVLKSRYVAQEFIDRNHLLPEIFRDSPGKPHTLWRGVQRFKDNIVNVREDTVHEVIKVSVEWTDAATAASWCNGFIALANDIIRNRAAQEANRSIAFLKDQIQRTNDVDLQHTMYNLIQTQTKTLMMANSRQDFALTVVDPAVAPEIRSSPKRTLMTLGGLGAGLVIGLIVAFAREGAASRRQ